MAAETLAFHTAIKDRQQITFTLDDEEYHFRAGKRAGMVLAIWDAPDKEAAATGAGKGLVDWLSDGLPDVEAERLRARLKNPDDDFDIEDLAAVAKGLLEKVTGRPFGSSKGSPVSPSTDGKSSTPEPSSADSTPSTLDLTAS